MLDVSHFEHADLEGGALAAKCVLLNPRSVNLPIFEKKVPLKEIISETTATKTVITD